MKSTLFSLVAALSLVSASSFASSLVCSSENIYSSNIKRDFGMVPPAGTVTGRVTIVHEGKVLLNYSKIVGLHPQGVPPYRVTLIGNPTVLEKLGSPVSGSTIFKQIAVLQQVNSLTHAVEAELANEEVVCRQTWAMVP